MAPSSRTATLLVVMLFGAFLSNSGNSATALNILGLFPHPAISHFHAFEPLMRGLAQAGHEVTVFSMFPQKQPLANYTDVVIPGQVLTAAIDLQVSTSTSIYTRNWRNWLRRFLGHTVSVSRKCTD